MTVVPHGVDHGIDQPLTVVLLPKPPKNLQETFKNPAVFMFSIFFWSQYPLGLEKPENRRKDRSHRAMRKLPILLSSPSGMRLAWLF